MPKKYSGIAHVLSARCNKKGTAKAIPLFLGSAPEAKPPELSYEKYISTIC